MRKFTILISLAAVTCLFGLHNAQAEEKEKNERYELAELLERTKTPLEKGLSASESQGQPISGKFETEDGKLQLSVYTAKDGKFSEITIDTKTGAIAKTEPITSGEDLTAAQTQNQAMVLSKSSLRSATEKAISENKGFAAISATPSLKDGHPVAVVTLINDEGEKQKTVSESLD